MSAFREDVELPRAYLRAALLLLVAEGPTHGYELLDAVRSFGVKSDAGGLYRMLRTLEQSGLLRSWWEDSSSGPPRRTYELSEDGRRASQSEQDNLRAQAQLLSDLVQHAEMTGAPPPVRR